MLPAHPIHSSVDLPGPVAGRNAVTRGVTGKWRRSLSAPLHWPSLPAGPEPAFRTLGACETPHGGRALPGALCPLRAEWRPPGVSCRAWLSLVCLHVRWAYSGINEAVLRKPASDGTTLPNNWAPRPPGIMTVPVSKAGATRVCKEVSGPETAAMRSRQGVQEWRCPSHRCSPLLHRGASLPAPLC